MNGKPDSTDSTISAVVEDQRFRPLPGSHETGYSGSYERANDLYEIKAYEFYKETGIMAPGKDQPAAMGNSPDYEERVDAWLDWLRARSHRIQLHPDASTRDPYGVVTMAWVYEVLYEATCFKEGWDQCAGNSPYRIPVAQYPDVRDFILGYIDFPYVTACAVALYICRDQMEMWNLSFTVTP